MAEIWGAAIMVVGAVASSQAAKKKAKQDKKDAQELTLAGAKYNAMTSQFEADTDYYYSQLNRQNKQRGLAEFRKFNNMSKIDPGYTQTQTGIILPEKPNAEEVFAEPVDTSTPKKKKKLTGLLAKDLGLF